MRSPSRTAAIAGGVGTALVSVGVSVVGLTWWRVMRASARSVERQPAPADALVVLGAFAYPWAPGRELAARLDHAVALYRQGTAALIVVSGGLALSTDEVDVMRRYLIDAGIPDDAILDGRPGDNSRETIDTTARLAAERGWTSVIAVSSAYHAHRLEVEGRRRGICVTASSSGLGPDMQRPRSRRARHGTEVAACLYYTLPPGLATLLRARLHPLRHTLANYAAGLPLPGEER